MPDFLAEIDIIVTAVTNKITSNPGIPFFSFSFGTSMKNYETLLPVFTSIYWIFNVNVRWFNIWIIKNTISSNPVAPHAPLALTFMLFNPSCNVIGNSNS